MTSNVGARQVKDFGLGVGFGTAAQKSQEDKNIQGVIQNALKKKFSPEFLNRIDDVVIFNNLDKDHLTEIIKLELGALQDRVKELGYSLSLSKKAITFLIDKGYDKQYGARPLARAIQRYVEDAMAGEILKKSLTNGSKVTFDWDGKSDELKLSIENNKATKKS
jgi:ATP-dependent Clp protease ATP-binding subunit ClpC